MSWDVIRRSSADRLAMTRCSALDLGDEICLLLRRTHRGLHAAAANRLTLRRGSRAKNPPSVDATFHEGKTAPQCAAWLCSGSRVRDRTLTAYQFLSAASCPTKESSAGH